MRRFSRETYETIVAGNRLSAAELSTMLERIDRDSFHRVARLAVIGASIAPARVRADQLLWFTDHEPFTSLGMYASSLSLSEDYERAASSWRRATARWPNDLRVLNHRAQLSITLDS